MMNRRQTAVQEGRRPNRQRAPALSPVVALVLLAATPAAAQEIPCQRGPCVGPQRPGTHFIAEVAGGATTYGSGGLALEGILGVGGKLRGFPPRFYLVAEFAYNSASTSGSSPTAGLGYRDERTYRDLASGLRIYLPIYGPVRLFGDALVGGSHVAASLEQQGAAGRTAEGWLPLVSLAGGIQVRLFHHLSVGMRAKVVLTDEDIEGLRLVVGGDSPTRVTATGGLTWHF